MGRTVFFNNVGNKQLSADFVPGLTLDGTDNVSFYIDAFLWADGARYDVETIALHEAGHGLSQGHFGKAFVTDSNNVLHFSPRAVMNAAYSGIQTQIGKTDNAGHCSNWNSWPNN